ncbi:putative small nuclear ribonucleoprotein G [Monocercomonoides exilis]|uniref:putative small nuclear ribonucleoprotein G n=1 Tax=Monocercomonoides exilis TaxID=2049356 RepID=UPI00355985C4|nr:putative small nuclear ribonucleoprotein G [Monocercomonoides exilis]
MASAPSFRQSAPDLKRFLEKNIRVKLNAGRTVEGVLFSNDHMLNIVLHNASEVFEKEKPKFIGTMVIRGSAIIHLECLDRL